MIKPILMIDPGHGGKDNGGGSNEFFKEKELNLQISLYQYDRFKSLNVPVAITRKEDTYLAPSKRAKIVRESGAKYCISNHINAASSNKARGVETIHSIFTDKKIATTFYQAIVDAGMLKRRVFSRKSNSFPGKDYYYMHRDTGSVITTIIEYGFATNTEDTKLLNQNWRLYAESIVRSFCELTGYKYINNKEEDLPQVLKTVNVNFNGKNIQGYINSDHKSYVEVRKLAEMLGLIVDWNAKTNTVEIIKRG